MPLDNESLRRVLIVDDNESVGELLTGAVREMGFEAAHSSGGANALALMAERPHGIVITDLQMAPMDGFQLASKLKRLYPEAVVSFLSGEVNSDVEDYAMQLGAFAYLRKPVSKAEIEAVVKRAFRRLCRQQKAGR